MYLTKIHVIESFRSLRRFVGFGQILAYHIYVPTPPWCQIIKFMSDCLLVHFEMTKRAYL